MEYDYSFLADLIKQADAEETQHHDVLQAGRMGTTKVWEDLNAELTRGVQAVQQKLDGKSVLVDVSQRSERTAARRLKCGAAEFTISLRSGDRTNQLQYQTESGASSRHTIVKTRDGNPGLYCDGVPVSAEHFARKILHELVNRRNAALEHARAQDLSNA